MFLQGFIFHLRARNLAPSTIAASADYLGRFLDGRDPLTVTRSDVENYLAGMYERCQPSSIWTVWQHLKSFFKWLEAEGDITVLTRIGPARSLVRFKYAVVVGTVAVQRNFDVAVGSNKAWQRFSEVERWPEWAPHIISVDVSPRGTLGPSSSGSLHIRKFGRNKFQMSAWEPTSHWEWTGGLPGVRITYDHQFEALSDNSTRMTWVVTIHGPFAWLISPIFRRIYGRDVDLAIPRLQEWIRE